MAELARPRLLEDTASTMMVNFRSLRDSGITWEALAGTPVDRVQARAGHEHIDTTIGYVKAVEDLNGKFGAPFAPLPFGPTGPTIRPSATRRAENKLRLLDSNRQGSYDSRETQVDSGNVEADLALDLAPRLIRPREAKRVLANVFAAPGRVRVGKRTISITLHPAGTTNELNAIRDWLADLNSQNLVLPADPLRRRLRFQSP
jgi:hypothetical protein